MKNGTEPSFPREVLVGLKILGLGLSVCISYKSSCLNNFRKSFLELWLTFWKFTLLFKPWWDISLFINFCWVTVFALLEIISKIFCLKILLISMVFAYFWFFLEWFWSKTFLFRSLWIWIDQSWRSNRSWDILWKSLKQISRFFRKFIYSVSRRKKSKIFIYLEWYVLIYQCVYCL